MSDIVSHSLTLLLAALALASAGCFRSPPQVRPSVSPAPLTADGLHNVFRLTDDLYSGGSPDGEAGFASLRDLGIRTIISVDGATPAWRKAAKHGFRYVHLPIGYDGVPEGTGLRIAKAVRDLPGPVYVHCHHGKHRGPAAAGCALLALEPSFTPAQAEAWLATAGTDPKYRGLIDLPRTFRRPTRAELDAAPADFPRVAEVPKLARLMVEVDERWAALAQGRPTRDPVHEAVQLAELYHEAARLSESSAKGEAFLALMRDAESTAEELGRANGTGAAFQRSQALCSKCHTKWRDR